MHPLYGAVPALFVPVPVTHSTVVSLVTCNMTFIARSVPMWSDLGDPVFDGVRLVS